MSSSKVELGQFYTTVNPFTHSRMLEWLQAKEGMRWLEPFAGANNIVTMIHDILPDAEFTSFDVAPGADGVIQRDTISSFPTGFDVVVTNPPYLARNSAKRRGLDQAVELMGRWPDLYLRCVEECLVHTPSVAAIIPESFIVSGFFHERLEFVISLNQRMFDDTEHPVCLAVFGPEATTDHQIWVGDHHVGSYTEIAAARYVPDLQMRFNDPNGRVGLCAVDGTQGPSIRFVRAADIARAEIKHSSRHRTRISVPHLQKRSRDEIERVISTANEILDHWRDDTGDVLLSPFMGLRRDGLYRRRIDFSAANGILSSAIRVHGFDIGSSRRGSGR